MINYLNEKLINKIRELKEDRIIICISKELAHNDNGAINEPNINFSEIEYSFSDDSILTVLSLLYTPSLKIIWAEDLKLKRIFLDNNFITSYIYNKIQEKITLFYFTI